MVWLFLWYPWEFEMLDGSKFRLRQGFPCGETLVRRNAPPRRAGPRPASASFSSTQDKKVPLCSFPRMGHGLGQWETAAKVTNYFTKDKRKVPDFLRNQEQTAPGSIFPARCCFFVSFSRILCFACVEFGGYFLTHLTLPG